MISIVYNTFLLYLSTYNILLFIVDFLIQHKEKINKIEHKINKLKLQKQIILAREKRIKKSSY